MKTLISIKYIHHIIPELQEYTVIGWTRSLNEFIYSIIISFDTVLSVLLVEHYFLWISCQQLYQVQGQYKSIYLLVYEKL